VGIVRGHSRDGQGVQAVQVAYEQEQIDEIINEMKGKPGIIEVLVQANEGKVDLGDELLAVVVAGDFRENVFPVLIETVNRIKALACRKKEVYT
jgi:molybdopterin synthase catalytic subunit